MTFLGLDYIQTHASPLLQNEQLHQETIVQADRSIAILAPRVEYDFNAMILSPALLSPVRPAAAL